jgi:arabinogalactan oligomer/maltooligosaccharide transport system substrate-binding protein
MTSDNGYYLYYDTSVITNPDSLEQIIADCEAAYAAKEGDNDNYLFRFALENAWYTASFFFATGCTSTWTTREDGEFTAVQDDFNSAKGMIAMKGMQKLASSKIYDSDADKYANAAAWVTGIWNANKAEEHFGDNFGVTDLPSFTVDGQSYHLGSYSGNKLMGVKPQADAEKAAFCSALALYLTNEECQMERYNLVQWGPSNLAAQQSEAVQANPSLAALAKQNAYATPQPQIFGGWWDIAKLLGSVAKSAKSDADLQAGLDNYKKTIDGLMALTPEQRQAFTVIGSINNSGWGTDFEMTQDAEGAWVSNDAFTLTETDEFKVRKGFAWDVAYGDNVENANTSIPTSNKANYKVTTPGTYYIKLVVNSDGTAEITLVPAN